MLGDGHGVEGERARAYPGGSNTGKAVGGAARTGGDAPGGEALLAVPLVGGDEELPHLPKGHPQAPLVPPRDHPAHPGLRGGGGLVGPGMGGRVLDLAALPGNEGITLTSKMSKSK